MTAYDFEWDIKKNSINEDFDINASTVKVLKREDVLPDYDPNRYSITVHYDLTEETEDDIFEEIIEDEVSKLRNLLYDKTRGMQRGERLNNLLHGIYNAVLNYQPS